MPAEDLVNMLTSLSNDKSQETLDDMQLIIDQTKIHHTSQSSTNAIVGQSPSLMTQPGAADVARITSVEPPGSNDTPVPKNPKSQSKRKANESAVDGTRKPKNPKKEKIKYETAKPKSTKEQRLEEHKEAYLAGTASNTNRIARNLVSVSINKSLTTQAKKREKEAEAKQKVENLARQVIQRGDNPVRHDGSTSAVKGNGHEGSVVEREKDADEDDGENSESCDINASNKEILSQSAERSVSLIKTYDEHLEDLSTELSDQAQIASLEHSASLGPNFLGRTASLTTGHNFGQYNYSTNGFTSQELLLPAADIRDENYCSHQRLTDLSQAELIYMIGNHLIWKDLNGDELLSYSKDPLFLVVHALRRYHGKEGDVTIQFLDRRKAKDMRGEPAVFYGALDLYTAYKVPQWRGWGAANASKLHPRKFTQEFLTHGPVLYPKSNLQQAYIKDLIRDGLYEIFPDFHAPDDHKRAGLYTLQVVLRRIGYPSQASTAKGGPIYSYDACSKAVPITTKLLEIVRKVTRNFCATPKDTDSDTVQPPLHIMICFLTFEKRPRGNEAFVTWVKEHYTAQDVLDLYTDPQGQPLPGITSVANNLPGYMQYLDLLRDCIEVFGLTPLPPNVVETAHPFDGTMDRSYAYAKYDDKQHRHDVKSTKYVQAQHLLTKKKNKGVRDKKNRKEIGSQEANSEADAITTSYPSSNETRDVLEPGVEKFEGDTVGSRQLLPIDAHEVKPVASLQNGEVLMSTADQAEQTEAVRSGRETAASQMQN